MKVKNFESFNFDGNRVNGTSYEVMKNGDKMFVCEIVEDDIIYKTQNEDYDNCVDSLKELFYITKNIKQFQVIPLFN